MTENWTILPEFDEGHQNRYIIMVSERSAVDDVAKKFPHICSQPFELKDNKYSWGLYVDNSTRDERKNIYRFFLGETTDEQELNKEEEVKNVISELKDIFSALTKDEQKHIEEKVPAKIESIEKFAEKKPQEEVATPSTVEPHIAGQEPPKVTKIETAPLSQPIVVEAPVESLLTIKVGYLYPSNAPEVLEKFISQLKAITEKSMKVPIYLEEVSRIGYKPVEHNDFYSIVSDAKLKKADIILAVIPDDIDDVRLFIDTACRRNEILYMVAQQGQLDKKFLFVDMAIELLLIKKKLR